MNGRKADGRRHKESGMLEKGTSRLMRRGLETGSSRRQPRQTSTLHRTHGLVGEAKRNKCNSFRGKHLHGFTLIERVPREGWRS